MESKTDPEESLKAVDQKINSIVESPQKGSGGRSKLAKYKNQKAKLISLKRGSEMLDEDWAEILGAFAVRVQDIHAKDRKFEQKATKILEDFTQSLTRIEGRRPQKPARVFPFSKKDYEFQNIADLKKIQREERRMMAVKNKEREVEKQERLEMKMEDYDAQVLNDAGDEEQEFSDEDSVGGQSMYIYKESREATPLPAIEHGLGYRHNQHNNSSLLKQ